MSPNRAVPFLIGFPVLFLLAIPWYWRFFPELATQIVAGFPLWVVASIGFSALISALVVVAVYTLWPSGDDDTSHENGTGHDDAEALAS